MSDIDPPKPPRHPAAKAEEATETGEMPEENAGNESDSIEWPGADESKEDAPKKKQGFFSKLFSKGTVSDEPEGESPQNIGIPSFDEPKISGPGEEESEEKNLTDNELDEIRNALGIEENKESGQPLAASDDPLAGIQAESKAINNGQEKELLETGEPDGFLDTQDYGQPGNELGGDQGNSFLSGEKPLEEETIQGTAPDTVLEGDEISFIGDEPKEKPKKKKASSRAKAKKKQPGKAPTRKAVSALQKKKALLEKKIGALEKKKTKSMKEYGEKIKKLKETLEEHSKKVSGLKAEQRKAGKELAQTRKENTQLEKTVKSQKEEKARLQKESGTLKKEIHGLKERLASEKQESEKKISSLKKEILEIQKERDSEKKKAAREKESYTNKRKELREKADAAGKELHELRVKSEEVLNNLRQKENLLREKEKNIQRLLEEQKRIQEYIEEKSLDSINPSQEILPSGEELDSFDAPDPFIDSDDDGQKLQGSNVNEDLQEKISDCRDVIGEGKIEDAKLLYNELRDEFLKSGFTGGEREKFYKELKELYDEISLKQLRGN